jgi:hypothetical protein
LKLKRETQTGQLGSFTVYMDSLTLKNETDPVWKGRAVWTILFAALAFRLLLVAYYTPRQNWAGDPRYYLISGKALAQTGTYSQDPTHDRMPGMTALVALGCQVGESGCRYFPLVLFALCGTASAAGLWWLLVPSLRLAARVPALFLLQFAILELQVFSFRLLPDLPALTLTVGAICLMVAAQRTYHILFGFLAGVLFGAALYLRPDYSLVGLAIVLTWSIAVYRRLGWARVAAFSAAVAVTALLLLLPWGARNYRLTGQFRLFSDLGNRVLWWAFNDHRNLDWNDGVAKAPSQQDMLWHQDGGAALASGLSWARNHPFDSAFLIGSRIVSHISPMPPGLIGAAATQIGARPLRWVYRAATIAVHESWLLVGIVAIAVGWRRFPLPLVLLAAFTVSRPLFPGAFIPDSGRYALVFVPFMACCAIWWVGSSEPLPVRPSWLGIVVLTLAIQGWFVFRWGIWR